MTSPASRFRLPGQRGIIGMAEYLRALDMDRYWPLVDGPVLDYIEYSATTTNGTPDRNQAGPFGSAGAPTPTDANYYSVPFTPIYSGDFTAAIWLRPDTTNDSCPFGKSGSNANYMIRTSTQAQVQGTTASLRTWTLPTIVTGQWEHLLVSRRSGAGEFYYNGAKVSGGGTLTSSYNYTILGRYNAAGRPCQGPIAHAFLGPVGLTEAQVHDLWEFMPRMFRS